MRIPFIDDTESVQHPKAEATQYLKATLAAFSPSEAINMTQGTWAKLHEAMSVLVEHKPVQEPFGFVSLHTNGDYYFSRFSSGVYRDTAKEITAVYTAPPAQPAPVQEPLTVKLKDDWRTDDFGDPIIYDTNEVDEVTGALTGDEGEEDSLTVLNNMVRYVSNVWPGKTAMQVLIECEEAMLTTPPAAPVQEPEEWDERCVLGHCGSPTGCELSNRCRADTPPAAQRQWVGLTDEQREEIAKGWRGRNWTVGDIIDAVEAAHGIKRNT